MSETEQDQKIGFFWARKLDLSRRYLSLTKKMGSVTDSSQMEKMRGLLNQRKRCADRINDTDKALERLYQSGLSRTGNALWQRFRDQTASILAEVAATEKIIIDWGSTQHGRIKSDLLRLQKGRQAIRGYQRPGQKAARCLDTFR